MSVLMLADVFVDPRMKKIYRDITHSLVTIKTVYLDVTVEWVKLAVLMGLIWG